MVIMGTNPPTKIIVPELAKMIPPWLSILAGPRKGPWSWQTCGWVCVQAVVRRSPIKDVKPLFLGVATNSWTWHDNFIRHTLHQKMAEISHRPWKNAWLEDNPFLSGFRPIFKIFQVPCRLCWISGAYNGQCQTETAAGYGSSSYEWAIDTPKWKRSKLPLHSHGRDGHQPCSIGVYICTRKGGITILNTRSLDIATSYP